MKNFNKEVGQRVVENERLGIVDNVRLNQSLFQELEVDRNSLLVRVQNLRRQIEELQTLRAELSGRERLRDHYETERARAQFHAAQAAVEAELANYNQLKAEVDRTAPVAAKGFISRNRYENLRASMETSAARVASLHAQANQYAVELAAVKAGERVGTDRSDTSYNRQRMDEMTIQVATLTGQLGENERRVEEISGQMAAEKKRLALSRDVVLSTPVNGVLWKKFFRNRSEVGSGNEIAQVIDCDNLFVEAELGEASISKLGIGSKVEYRLRGSNRWLSGHVFAKFGSGNMLRDRSLAAVLPVDRGSGKIWISLHPRDLPDLVANQCHVGRQVEVAINRQLPWTVWFTRLTALFS